MINQLKELFGSRLKAIEMLALLKNQKPVVRQGFYPSELDRIKQFCEKNEMMVEKSQYKVVMEDREKFSNKGKIVDIDNKQGMFLVYMSKSQFNALWTCLYETKQDHINTGLMLGYPECCVKFFAEEFAKGNINPVHRPLNPWTNLLLRDEDIALISHFPCRSDCEKSVAIAKKNLALMERYDKQMADMFYKRLDEFRATDFAKSL